MEDFKHCTSTPRTASDSGHEKEEDDVWKWTEWVLFLLEKKSQHQLPRQAYSLHKAVKHI